jgi:hypothetical protein
MYKNLLALTLALALAFTSVAPALAQVEIFSGEVVAIDATAGTFTLETAEGVLLVVTPPAGFDLSTLTVGDLVDVEGLLTGDSLAADSVTPAEEPASTVLSIDLEAGTFEIETPEGETLTVIPPEGFDLSTLAVGDLVLVEGVVDGDTLTATSIVPASSEVDEGEDEDGGKNGFYCTNADASHPALANLAESFEADYGQLLSWFCEDGFGVGQIMLALATSQISEGAMSADDALAARAEGAGWGQVWKDLGLKGPDRQDGDSGNGNGNGQGNGNGNGNSNAGGNGNGNGGGNGNGKGNGNGNSDD